MILFLIGLFIFTQNVDTSLLYGRDWLLCEVETLKAERLYTFTHNEPLCPCYKCELHKWHFSNDSTMLKTFGGPNLKASSYKWYLDEDKAQIYIQLENKRKQVFELLYLSKDTLKMRKIYEGS